ncbi:hypothetical protein MB46_10650 [Arthrobacter alpinus]|uniref:AAA family ATPase n=1 Tax=Arthrobacter alpinus TaxID=656366 RepID=UPI0005C7E955|nr:AAA family ATPase [Arthrobacter alpinus]ALV45871.1 hypothetical protein MB46_10650 [Arthrobacter alpinus]
MRIHRLEIQAFGPFAGREIVDFDVLGSQGLFLLNGSTGAGKTSVLDAIAYAFYGQVPGARQGSVRRLRSHHAEPGMGPEVMCEFTAGGRRLEVTRSPEWLRPVKRGTGTTRENASTALRERVDGAWVALSQRNDEAASEIQRLLGMNMAQFTKVVLLAQGEFAAFLRADAKDRQELLEKLFGTEVYKDLENHLVAAAKDAQAGVTAGVAELVALEQVARSQAAGVLPAASEGGDSDEPGDPEPLEAETTGAGLFRWLEAELAVAVEQAQSERAHLNGLLEESQQALSAAQDRKSRHDALESALHELARLAELAPQVAAWDTQLSRHHKAEVLAGSVKADHGAGAELIKAESKAAEALAQLSQDDLASRTGTAVGATGVGTKTLPASQAQSDITELESVERILSGQEATVAQILPQELRLVAVDAELIHGEEQLLAAQHDVAKLEVAQSRGKEQLTELKEKLGVLRAKTVSLEKASQQLAEATAQLASIEAHTAQLVVVEMARGLDLAARENVVNAKQLWLGAVEHRLALAAGELAAGLVDGEPCMVCGSTIHPAPSPLAGSGADAVRAEKKAKDALTSLEKAAVEAAATLVKERQWLAVLVERGGDGVRHEAAAAVERCTAALAAATDDAARLQEWEAEQGQLETDIAASWTVLLAAKESVASLLAANSALVKESTQLSAGLQEARDGYATLSLRQQAIATALAATTGALAALRRKVSALQSRDAAAASLQEALQLSDFATSADVEESLMAAPTVAATKANLDDHARAQTLLAAALESDQVRAARQESEQGLEAPDPETLLALERSLLEHRKAREDASLRFSLAENALARVSITHAEHAAKELSVAPLRDHANMVSGLADAARGGGDNQLKMTLTSYVLAARLEQVAEAASLRLSTMSGDRYSLTHSDAKAGGNKKSGLGLAVVDGWTQLSRDTSTLSGGESFMASLSLALGLADVVQQESGGLDIETLFVDEGFGSLDEESLDQVMDALEGLRDGGRMVGLVSHVADMKSRIPLHLHVVKGRTGSTLRVGESV